MNRRQIILSIITLLLSCELPAQQKIIVAGVVNDKNYDAVKSAKVYTKSGDATFTDSLGTFYLMMRNENDSVYVQYKTMHTKGYAIPENKILSITLNLYLNEFGFTEKEILPDVNVVNKNHFLDSLQNRSEYAKIFDAPSSGQYLLRYLSNPFNLGNLFSGLQFKKNKKRQFYKDFAISLEQDNYVKHRFSKAFVLEYTGLTGTERDEFMAKYAPTYEQVLFMDEITLAQYTLNAFKKYQAEKKR